MREIILDERAWAENAIDSLCLGVKPVETLGRIAKYYFSEGYSKKEIAKMLEEFVIKCDPTASVAKWQEVIDSISKNADRYPLIDINGISITKSEMAAISALKTKMLKRLMFTLLCIAKYGNAINPKNNNWVNCEAKDFFNMANIKTTSVRQSLLINDLWQLGYIGYSNVIDNVNLNVRIVADDEEELFITDFRNLGNQYMDYIDGGYMKCENCGIIVKIHNNKQRYCPECSDDMRKKRDLGYYYSKVS